MANAAAKVLTVLAEPNRRKILDLLVESPRAVGEIVEGIGASQPTTSKHLRVLREANLVRVERRGQCRIYHLRPEPLRHLDAWLEPYRRLWSSTLDRLERALDEQEGSDEG